MKSEVKQQTKDQEFASIAEEVFAPIYPVLADIIIARTKVTTGRCLDLGAGPGYLGLSIAKRCKEIQVTLYDQSEEMLTLAERQCRKTGLSDRVSTLKGDAADLPYSDNTMTLVVSRGSIFFWENQVQAINEIYRVLAPGGQAYIGGGFGNKALFLQIKKTMARRVPDWNENRATRMAKQNHHHFASILDDSRVPTFSIDSNDPELWIYFKK